MRERSRRTAEASNLLPIFSSQFLLTFSTLLYSFLCSQFFVETVKEVLSETQKPKSGPRAKDQQGRKQFPDDAAQRLANTRDERSEDDSVSKNFSVQTTTTEKRGDEVDTGEQRPRTRSSAEVQKKRSFSGELSCKREREMHHGEDVEEHGRARSVSPAAKQRASGAQCRSLSALRTSPRRVPPRRAQGVHGRGGLEAKESLENPLVSLECFIFL